MLAFAWTINKSKDSAPVCLPSSALPRAHQAGSTAAPASCFVSERICLCVAKGQWLCFAGAAVKRYPHTQGKRNPSKTVGVARGHQRADTLKPYSQKTSQSNHTDHSLV